MKGTSEETRFTVLERKTTSNSIISLGHGRCSSSDCFAGDVPHCTTSAWTKSTWQSSCLLERLDVMVISSQWDSFSFVCTCDLAHNEPESFQPKGSMNLKVFSGKLSRRCTFTDPEKWKCVCDRVWPGTLDELYIWFAFIWWMLFHLFYSSKLRNDHLDKNKTQNKNSDQ